MYFNTDSDACQYIRFVTEWHKVSFAVTTQSFLSAIEKPVQATIIAVAAALVFLVILLGALWSFGLYGIWANFVGVNLFTAIFGVFLLLRVGREIKKKSKV